MSAQGDTFLKIPFLQEQPPYDRYSDASFYNGPAPQTVVNPDVNSDPSADTERGTKDMQKLAEEQAGFQRRPVNDIGPGTNFIQQLQSVQRPEYYRGANADAMGALRAYAAAADNAPIFGRDVATAPAQNMAELMQKRAEAGEENLNARRTLANQAFGNARPVVDALINSSSNYANVANQQAISANQYREQAKNMDGVIAAAEGQLKANSARLATYLSISDPSVREKYKADLTLAEKAALQRLEELKRNKENLLASADAMDAKSESSQRLGKSGLAYAVRIGKMTGMPLVDDEFVSQLMGNFDAAPGNAQEAAPAGAPPAETPQSAPKAVTFMNGETAGTAAETPAQPSNVKSTGTAKPVRVKAKGTAKPVTPTGNTALETTLAGAYDKRQNQSVLGGTETQNKDAAATNAVRKAIGEAQQNVQSRFATASTLAKMSQADYKTMADAQLAPTYWNIREYLTTHPKDVNLKRVLEAKPSPEGRVILENILRSRYGIPEGFKVLISKNGYVWGKK